MSHTMYCCFRVDKSSSVDLPLRVVCGRTGIGVEVWQGKRQLANGNWERSLCLLFAAPLSWLYYAAVFACRFG
jgi:hypothetical protein